VQIEDANDAQVLAVCGVPPSADQQPNTTLLFVNSVFPSQTMGREREETKGGVVVVKLRVTDPAKPLAIRTSFTAFDGQRHSSVQCVQFAAHLDQPQFESSSIRKAVLLVRWTALMKSFLEDAHSANIAPSSNTSEGICYRFSGTFGLTATNSAMLQLYLPLFVQFLKCFEQESALLDDDLSQWRDSMSGYVIKAEELAKAAGDAAA